MMIIALFLFLLYFVCISYAGILLLMRLFPSYTERPQIIVYGFLLLGIMFGTAVTYYVSWIISPFTTRSISIAALMVTLVLLLLSRKHIYRHILIIKKRIRIEGIIILPAVLLSFYIMWKSFRIDAAGTLLIERNVIFDFAHLLSIMRSFSLGDNLPYLSPFLSGTPHVYHFFFPFLTAIGEQLGLPVSLAVTISSVIGFTLFLLIIYAFCRNIFRLPFLLSALGMIIVPFQSSLTLPFLIKEKGISLSTALELWRLPNYIYAGPFDGSIISIFITLNVFVNQRHLAFVLALCLFIVAFLQLHKKITKRELFFLGLLLASCLPWHVVLIPFMAGIILFTCLLRRTYTSAVYTGIGFLLGVLPYIIYWLPAFNGLLQHSASIYTSTNVSLTIQAAYPFVQFFVENIGIILFFFIIGIISQRKKATVLMLTCLLSGAVVINAMRHGNIDQKFFSVFLLCIKLFAVAGIYPLFHGRYKYLILCCLVPLFVLPGIIDLFVIKNDYVLRVPDYKNQQVMKWVTSQTLPTSTFLSYGEMFSLITLSGRREYNGFFKQILPTREDIFSTRIAEAKRIYESPTVEYLRQTIPKEIDYVLVPKKERSDFTYAVDPNVFRNAYPIVYEDEDQFIIAVGNKP